MKNALAATIMFLTATPAGAGAEFELPLMPPEAPAEGEIPVSSEDDPVAQSCALHARRIWNSVGATPVRVVITKSENWGTI